MAKIDAQELKTRITIQSVIENDLGQPARSGTWLKWFCPFHDDRDTPSLAVKDGNTSFYCFGCQVAGDIFTWRELRHNEDFQTALESLLGVAGGTSSRETPAQKQSVRRSAKLPGDSWQESTRALVADWQARLWTAEGDRARAWLHKRGISDETARAWGLGFSPGDKKRGLARGIAIPWLDGTGRLWGVKVATGRRRTGSKYVAVTGSRMGSALFGVDHMAGGDALFAVEGEFDAMLLWQEIGDRADVLTLGSNGGRLADRWLAALLPSKRFLIATDADDAGEKAAAYWLDLVGERGRRIYPPMGEKDVTDAWKVGADLRGWAREHLGDDVPSDADARLSRRVSALERNAASHASRLDDLAQRRWRGKILELSDFPAVAERHELRVVAGEWDGVGPVVVNCEEGV